MSVVVENLTKRFSGDGVPAVSEVSFTAPTGRITALLGPSGAGKSTVLRLVAGLEAGDDGRIRIAGEDITLAPIQKRGVGLVFQNYALFPNLSVRENIAFGLRVRKAPRADVEARVDELLGLIKLKELGGRFPSQLSGGQRQRVAFARALAVRPKVLLLDEPFGALDARVRHELREWLHEMHEETGVTTLLVTHDQAEALELAEHVVVMFDGRVAQVGAPHDVYDHPATPGVAELIGGANVLGAAFVRPHDVKLALPEPHHDELSVGRIQRLRRIGGYMKLTLELPNGEIVTMEAPRADIEALGLGEGDRVVVDLRAAKVFVEDYAI